MQQLELTVKEVIGSSHHSHYRRCQQMTRTQFSSLPMALRATGT